MIRAGPFSMTTHKYILLAKPEELEETTQDFYARINEIIGTEMDDLQAVIIGKASTTPERYSFVRRLMSLEENEGGKMFQEPPFPNLEAAMKYLDKARYAAQGNEILGKGDLKTHITEAAHSLEWAQKTGEVPETWADAVSLKRELLDLYGRLIPHQPVCITELR
jgi:hypothetical protein